MNDQPFIKYIFILCLFFSTSLIAQTGIISGTLTDSSGSPLSGAYIKVVKAERVTRSSSLHGSFHISCAAGDILIFTYPDVITKTITVTADMFGHDHSMILIKQKPVTKIYSTAYEKAVQQHTKPIHTILDIKDSPRKYGDSFNFQYDRIKNIETEKDKVALTYFSSDIFYEIGGTSATSFQFIQQKNLPKLQSTYSQGRPSGGRTRYVGPETGEFFSYGPQLTSLKFNNATNPYDQNGNLVSIGNGTGKAAKPYNNRLLTATTKTSNRVFFNISTNIDFLGFNYTNNKNEDLYGRQNSHADQLEVRYKHKKSNSRKVFWDTFVKYANAIDNQPNINGFENNLLLNLWATPASFDIHQGTTLSNNNQRSFSPNRFNNPNWLLENNRNQTQDKSFIASIQNSLELSDIAEIKTNLNYTNTKNDQKFGVLPNTIGFIEGYSSDKTINNDVFDANLSFSLQEDFDGFDLNFISTTNYGYHQLSYSLIENIDFDEASFMNPQNSFVRNQQVSRNTFHLQNKLRFVAPDFYTTITLANHSFISSIQNNKWFLPSLIFKVNLKKIIRSYNIDRFFITTSTSFDVNDIPLFYDNQSHNSLLFNLGNSLSYTANNDLFITDDVLLEEKQNYEISADLSINIFRRRLDMDATFFNTTTKNSVFPVYEQNQFQLKNVADINSKGFEFNINTHLFKYGNLRYTPGIVFSTYRTKVARLLEEKERIPIAGFSTVSKNLVKGQPAGILIGSAYARNEQNEIIIDEQGFPLVASAPKIIGDPTPDFNLGFNNSFTWKRIGLDFLIDFQKGGDIWNGTQNVLNYLGTSQQSADQRNITDFIFDGVNQQGETNTIAVDFANPNTEVSNNRFVRYGFEGVAEDAIEDGSYLNLKSVNLKYTVKKQNDSHLIRELSIGLYGENLFTWSKFNGASPYNSLFGNSSAQGIHFFNTPIISEIGMQIKIKI